MAAGVVNGLGYACVYVAEQTLTGGTAAVICASSPLFTLLLARLFGLEPLLPQRLLGMAMGLSGVSVLFADGLELGGGHFQAMLLAGIAGFCAAFAIRAGAMSFGWKLPTYRSRPGRDYK